MKGIPPTVTVINEHDQQIKVVVSKFKPKRLLTAAGINASTTGAGLNYETAVYFNGYYSSTKSTTDLCFYY
jgi:hypothetical protein